ncbi:MAG: MFS transporter, partial [Chloroflexi bacterium]|nr:MFS transporter [Chloroflexota bacterium]
MRSGRPSGMFAFTVVWIGQVISLMGSAMTGFALTIWAWKVTGSATALALVGFFNFGPTVLLSPIAGALVDRWNRKLVMMLSDLAAGLSTVAILLLYTTGRLQIWHLYVAGAFSGAFQAFQWPAYSAAISTMLPKSQYARASGMISLAESGSGVFAPLLAGFLITVIDISGIMLIDVITFVAAISALLAVYIPRPAATEEGRKGQGSLLKESGYGFRYIRERPSLLGLQLVFFAGNLLGSVGFTLLAPMLLARTNNNEIIFGSVQSAFGVGGVAGGLLLSAWGGPERRVHGVLLGHVLIGVLGQTLMGLGHGLPVWVAAAFLASFLVPFINGANQAIWQAKVAPDVQGRVFATRRLIAQISAPLAILIAGPLADRVFEPAMQAGGGLAGAFGWLVGSGPGSGMSLMLVLSGLLVTVAGAAGYLFPAVRYAEDILPDHAAGGAA